jgi:hypothetical protein
VLDVSTPRKAENMRLSKMKKVVSVEGYIADSNLLIRLKIIRIAIRTIRE